MMVTIHSLIKEGATLLERTSSSPQLDAELFVAAVLSVSRIHILSHGEDRLSREQEWRIRELLHRRAQGEPVAYLTGHQEFWSLEFEVGPDVLIPRPETELLVELALQRVSRGGTVVDLGTGSGCIAIAIAVESKRHNLNLSVVATDRSAAALEIARRNAAKHGVEQSIEFRTGQWWEPLENDRFSTAVSNPPYIAVGDRNVSQETRFEPQSALYAGSDGLTDIKELLRGAPSHLNACGTLLIEFGSSQGEEIRKLPCAPLRAIEIHRDLAGHDRVGEWQLSV